MSFHRLAHMKDTPLVRAGQWVKRGMLLGYVGSTGNSSGPHLHYDIMRERPVRFTQYVYGMPKAAVQALYADPNPYIKGLVPADRSLPSIGFHYLQYVALGSYFHPGEDVNGVNDSGKPILSPVEGRVVFVLGTNAVKNMFGKLVTKNFNSGWGNMCVIEEMPGYTIP